MDDTGLASPGIRREPRVREGSVGLPSDSFHRLARKLIGRIHGHALGMTKCPLIVGKPVEHPLPNDGHHNLDLVGVADLGSKRRFGMLNRADDQNASPHQT